MKKNIFFEFLPNLLKLKFINKFNNFDSKINKKISKKQYKYIIKLIKQYHYLNIFYIKVIKFIKVK